MHRSAASESACPMCRAEEERRRQEEERRRAEEAERQEQIERAKRAKVAKARRPYLVPGYIGAIGGASVLLVGGLKGLSAKSDESSLSDQCLGKQCPESARRTLTASRWVPIPEALRRTSADTSKVLGTCVR